VTKNKSSHKEKKRAARGWFLRRFFLFEKDKTGHRRDAMSIKSNKLYPADKREIEEKKNKN